MIRNLVAKMFDLYTELPPRPVFGLDQATTIVNGIRQRGITPDPKTLVPVRVALPVFGVQDVFADQAHNAISRERSNALDRRAEAQDLRQQAEEADQRATGADERADLYDQILQLFGEK